MQFSELVNHAALLFITLMVYVTVKRLSYIIPISNDKACIIYQDVLLTVKLLIFVSGVQLLSHLLNLLP
jgi:hypothetical protein